MKSSWIIDRVLWLLISAHFIMISAGCQVQPQIVLSSRFFHPRHAGDTLNTMSVVTELNVQRLEWLYESDSARLNILRKKKIPFSLTLNPQAPDSGNYTTTRGRIVDIDGKALVAPWMKNWNIKNPFWGCVNNPFFQQLFITKAQQLVDLGAYGLMVDDSRFNDHAVEWGGCYCDFCMQGFSSYLSNKGIEFNRAADLKQELSMAIKGEKNASEMFAHFRNFQTVSVVRFLKTFRKEIKDYSSGKVQLLTNNYNGNWTEIYKVFDIGVAEIKENKASLGVIAQSVETANEYDKKQVFSFASGNKWNNYKVFCWSYLHGAECLIPWDVYMPDESRNGQTANRYYTSVNEFSYLTEFVSTHTGLFTDRQNLLGSTPGITVTPGSGAILKNDKSGYYLFVMGDVHDDREVTVSIDQKMFRSFPLLTRLMHVKSQMRSGTQLTYSGKIVVLKLEAL